MLPPESLIHKVKFRLSIYTNISHMSTSIFKQLL